MCEEIIMNEYSLTIHPIHKEGDCYYYIANANLIVKTDYKGACALNNYCRHDRKIADLDNQISEVEQAHNEIIYLHEKWKRLNHAASQCEFSHAPAMIEGIRIIPTLNCNMDCNYCPLKLNKQIMDIDLASKVVNFIKSSPLGPRIHIKFYGGEPFINFPVIEYIVEELTLRLKGRHTFLFSATTNGTIINDKILDFLVRYNFNLAISLDGPPQLHNKNRTFRNKQGSFNIVFKNIQKIREKNEKYFYNHVTIQPTLNPKSYTDYKRTMDFFLLNKFQNISVSWLIQKNSLLNRNILQDIIFRIINHNYDSFPFIDLLKYLDLLRMDRGSIKMHTCGAGTKRLAISPIGELFPCEQLLGNEYYRIGDILTGVNVKSLNKIFAPVYACFKKCSKCWAVRFCPYYCFAIKPFSKKKLCHIYKKKIEQIMEIYISLAEQNPNCYLDFLSFIHSNPIVNGDDDVLL